MVQFVKITGARYEERSRSTYIRAGAGRHQRCGGHASGLGSRIQLPTVPLAEPLKCRPHIVRARSPASHQAAAPVAILQLGWLLRCSIQKTHECWQYPLKWRKKLTIAIAKSTIADAPTSHFPAHFPANTVNEIFIFEIILLPTPPNWLAIGIPFRNVPAFATTARNTPQPTRNSWRWTKLSSARLH